MVSPVNEPLTDFVSAGVGEGVGVFVTALFVAVELLDEEFEVLELFEVIDDELELFEEVDDDALAFFVALLLVAFFAVTFAALELALALTAGAAACVAVTAAVAGTV